MKRFALIAVAAALSACTPKAEQKTFEVLPDDLKDCKFYGIRNGSGENLNVVRCPNSTTSTTYREGKHDETVVVIDGAEYVRKEPK